ncbi:Gfo/Idh/MocA family oxidoreductase [Blastococcus sp. SYSU DS0510]
MRRRLRWGIVGTGGISRTTAGDLHLTENLDLVAVASRTPAGAEAFAAEIEVPKAYGDHDALFACWPASTSSWRRPSPPPLPKLVSSPHSPRRRAASSWRRCGCGSTRRSSGSWTSWPTA